MNNSVLTHINLSNKLQQYDSISRDNYYSMHYNLGICRYNKKIIPRGLNKNKNRGFFINGNNQILT